MNTHPYVGSLAVGAFAVSAAIAYALRAVRTGRGDVPSALSNFFAVVASLIIGALVLLHVASAVVGYAVLCLALAIFQLFDLLQDEQVRRRRAASLVPRPAAEAVPTVWVAVAAASVLILAPYVILGEQRGAALMVGTCALIIAGIAWRVASGPVQLRGENIRDERMRDRASRTRKAGVPAVIAIGSIFVFISFREFQPARRAPVATTLASRFVRYVGSIGRLGRVVLAPSRPALRLDVVKDLFLTVDPDLAPFQQIMEQFRSLIERGELRAGDALPTVRQLARDLGVAANTVARAYADLQEEGWLICDGRRGTRVASGVRTSDKTRAGTLQETIARFLESLVHRGYSQVEIAAALRGFVK